jgi:NADH-quinone oxidoreductase subunit K
MSLSLPELGLIFSILLFLIGIFGVMFRSNILFQMMGIELMLNAANLAFVSASKMVGNLDGQVVVFFVMAIAACEAAVGLALVVALYRERSTTETDSLTLLRG